MDPDLIKILIILPFFIIACITDLKDRIVPNKLWIPLIIIAVIFLAIQFNTEYITMLGISLAITLLIILLMGLLNFGGADLKAVIVIALIFPVYPETLNPITSEYSIFVITTIINGLLIALIYPVAITTINLLKGDTEKPSLIFQAIKKPVEKVNEKERVWHENKFKTYSKKELEILKRKKKKVWTTPWIPFIVFITIGMIAALTIGDLLYIIFTLTV
ncbi:A24 family peptidase [Methanonatronarchaeum sp. AMET6-2]|uniref:A24 family peptidase n=1 Tax=Methanonatronarchaeum sp. AMET6-2 TaxID=2933293 RepID=UPI0011F781EE|nr:A24 family peptidase [Methanonatronarchaeum sp. AMET6-2]RZN62080.1 MAG: A24 family peptidase [Methanonatronarchaeia archaeon]UOY09777.1 prepilin peptidase [Methanonatronarchaeum sp. AMET6-2]